MGRREEVRKGLQTVRVGVSSMGGTPGLRQPETSLGELVNYADTAMTKLFTSPNFTMPTYPPTGVQFGSVHNNQPLQSPELRTMPITTPPGVGQQGYVGNSMGGGYTQRGSREGELMMRSPVETIATAAATAAQVALAESPMANNLDPETSETLTRIATAAATAAVIAQYRVAQSSMVPRNSESRSRTHNASNDNKQFPRGSSALGGGIQGSHFSPQNINSKDFHERTDSYIGGKSNGVYGGIGHRKANENVQETNSRYSGDSTAVHGNTFGSSLE